MQRCSHTLTPNGSKPPSCCASQRLYCCASSMILHAFTVLLSPLFLSPIRFSSLHSLTFPKVRNRPPAVLPSACTVVLPPPPRSRLCIRQSLVRAVESGMGGRVCARDAARRRVQVRQSCPLSPALTASSGGGAALCVEALRPASVVLPFACVTTSAFCGTVLQWVVLALPFLAVAPFNASLHCLSLSNASLHSLSSRYHLLTHVPSPSAALPRP